MDLLSVDLLLNDPSQPGGATWPGNDVMGEAARGLAIDPPTMDNLDAALKAVVKDAAADEGLLLLFCGHGFSRTSRYYVASDFGETGSPWSRVVDLSALELGLRQIPPRTQWLFWDCCADIPMEILDALGPIGGPLIQPRGSKISAAETAYGKLSRFGVASAPPGEQAFGVASAPSRFTEMLIEAVEGSAPPEPEQRRLVGRRQRHARRDPDLCAASSRTGRPAVLRLHYALLLRCPAAHPVSAPCQGTEIDTHRVLRAQAGCAEERARHSHSRQRCEDNPIFVQNPPGASAVIHVPVPARRSYKVTAVFNTGAAAQTRVCYADLPLAEAAEFELP